MKKGSNNIIVGIFLLIIGMVFGGVGTVIVNEVTKTDEQRALDDLAEIIETYSYYYEDEEALMEGALRGMVASLGDPYSVYMNDEEFRQMYEHLDSEAFAGMGVYLETVGPYTMIYGIVPNSPAESAGLKPGDIILSVDGTDIYEKTIDEIGLLVKGHAGEDRTLEIARKDIDTSITINVTLDLIPNDTINYEVNEINGETIGYLQIVMFSDKEITYRDFLDAMSDIETQNIDSLIIDVRNNPGGYLDTVTMVLDYFLDSEEPFMYEETTFADKEELFLGDHESNINYEIAVLINEYSASAAEIFAATMNEVGGYELIGKTTYGKGIGQQTVNIDFAETMWVKLTTFAWLTSKGEWIQGVGVAPTMEVEQEGPENLTFIDLSDEYEFDEVDDDIRDIQFTLIQLGYTVRTDGYYDIATENAIKDYQLNKDLSVTGVVDDETAYFLNLDLITYLEDEDFSHDEQYQSALSYVLGE